MIPKQFIARRIHESGQIIATSHDRFPPNAGLVREIPLFQGNLGWYLARCMEYFPTFTIKINHSLIGKYTSPMEPPGTRTAGCPQNITYSFS